MRIYVLLYNSKEKSSSNIRRRKDFFTKKNQVDSVRNGPAGKRSTELELAISVGWSTELESWQYEQEHSAWIGTTQQVI